MAFLSAGYLALGPGVRYVEAGFGTTVFAFFVAVGATAWVALRLSPGRSSLGVGFGFAGLAMGLARPEGAALAVLLALSLILLVDANDRAPIAIRFALTFGMLGSIYFLWHWVHFGYPLPNPVYIRAVDGGHLRSLRDAVKCALFLLVPLAPAIALHLWKADLRTTAALMFPAAGFVTLWAVLSHSMNFMMRYQYPLLPLALVTWAPTTAALSRGLGALSRKVALSSSISIAVAVILFVPVPALQRGRGLGDERRAIGLALGRFSHRYTMATTEAGQLPLYSGWRAVDAWGLNDSWVAHHGLTEEYLEENHPALIVISPYSTASTRWHQMVICLEDFAKSRQYTLASAAPLEFYVAPWALDSVSLIDAIQRSKTSVREQDRGDDNSAIESATDAHP